MTTIIKRTPITMDGKYKTASGKNVRILCVDAGGDYPVVGLVEGVDGAECWTHDGFFTVERHDSGYDLVAVPETRTVWVNVYDDGSGPYFGEGWPSEDRSGNGYTPRHRRRRARNVRGAEMTPSEIADWLDIEANTLGHVPMLAGDAPYLRQAAATIRELEARALQAEEDAEMWEQGFAGSKAKLKIATEALEEIGAQTMSMHFTIDGLARHGIRSANEALARIKEV